tara:strand:- start:51 stop:341 length:291 start_codon:yes stop_codon:yes gene_type:complete
MISRFPIVNAIKELDPNAEFEYSPEEDTINIIKSDLGITESEIRDKAELVKYKSDRVPKYPSIQEQLDMQYHDAINGTTTWKDSIAKVKADNPKPE